MGYDELVEVLEGMILDGDVQADEIAGFLYGASEHGEGDGDFDEGELFQALIDAFSIISGSSVVGNLPEFQEVFAELDMSFELAGG